MSEPVAHIQFALISHTNAGKTTLARTLIGMDVGEVRDAPHVTSLSESHVLLTSSAGDVLELWDTPGFGDSVRLQKRLGSADNPVGWFLREVVDRYRDRPFWFSQQALRTARESADVVLYLVNASEDPQDTGYLAPEMQILQWLDKPVVILLNQMGPPRPAAEEYAEEARWRQYLARYAVVREVITLDAFARCWVHERVFFETVGKVIAGDKQVGYGRLLKTWEQQNQSRLHASMALLARQLSRAAQDSEAVEAADGPFDGRVFKAIGMGRESQRKREAAAMEAMMARLQQAGNDMTAGLLRLHKIDPGAADKINQRVLDAFVVRAPVDTTKAGLLGAMVSGAATGLSADLLAGGLSFGAGALIGGIVGALGFAGAAWTVNASTGDKTPSVRFSDVLLRSLVADALLRYLAVMHFGRGRGNFVQGEAPPFWQEEVETVVQAEQENLQQAWRATLDARNAQDQGQSDAALAAALTQATARLLERLYPR